MNYNIKLSIEEQKRKEGGKFRKLFLGLFSAFKFLKKQILFFFRNALPVNGTSKQAKAYIATNFQSV